MTTEDWDATITAQAINRIKDGEFLNRPEIATAFYPILRKRFRGADVAWGTFFAELQHRGPTSTELLGLTAAILAFDEALAHHLGHRRIVDTERTVVAITGSGKESFKTFNVSTAAALVASSHPDICVLKPAGPATSAVTGATDAPRVLGLRVPSTLTGAAAMAESTGFGVVDYHLVAPRYGRRYEGLFHHLHPLSYVNPWFFLPFRVHGLLFGVAEPPVELAASVMASVGLTQWAMVATTRLGGYGRIDEVAPFGQSYIAVLQDERIRCGSRRLPVPGNLEEIAQRNDHRTTLRFWLASFAARAPRSPRTWLPPTLGCCFDSVGSWTTRTRPMRLPSISSAVETPHGSSAVASPHPRTKGRR